MHAMFITQRRKHGRSNQPRKRHRKDIPRIKNSHSRRNLFPRIKHTQDIQRSRVERSFNKTVCIQRLVRKKNLKKLWNMVFNEPETEAHKDQSSVVLN